MAQIDELLDQINATIEELLQRVDAIRSYLLIQKLEAASKPEIDPQKPNTATIEMVLERETEGDNTFEQLRKLVQSDEWPAAVNPELICDHTDADKMDRAEGILQLLPALTGEKFLDFGCGEGHVAMKANDFDAKISIGYDIKKQGNFPWEGNKSPFLTTNFDKVVENGPYDLMLIYDVLDHMESSEIVPSLEKLKDLLADNGEIYVRTHPWCSRHGGHLYRHLNKAFAHLVFEDDELAQLGIDVSEMGLQRVIHPVATAGSWISRAGLKIKRRNVERQNVDKFFENNALVRERIVSHWKESPDKSYREQNKFPSIALEQTFLDFVLVKS